MAFCSRLMYIGLIIFNVCTFLCALCFGYIFFNQNKLLAQLILINIIGMSNYGQLDVTVYEIYKCDFQGPNKSNFLHQFYMSMSGSWTWSILYLCFTRRCFAPVINNRTTIALEWPPLDQPHLHILDDGSPIVKINGKYPLPAPFASAPQMCNSVYLRGLLFSLYCSFLCPQLRKIGTHIGLALYAYPKYNKYLLNSRMVCDRIFKNYLWFEHTYSELPLFDFHIVAIVEHCERNILRTAWAMVMKYGVHSRYEA